ncbi:MAG TPA: spore coat protein GerQ [Candidatus Onthocola stercorigallinarum]|nr:spore coat protein GerQ [Candidatus Onthocola stercorigallinarum]
MNGSFYQNPTFPGNNYQTPQTPPGNISINDVSNTSIPLTMEQSYIENILRLNKGRKVKAYVSYPDSSAWQNKIYEGIIEEAGKDHLIIYDNANNLWYLIRIIYLNYVEFMEPIIYSHAYSDKTY